MRSHRLLGIIFSVAAVLVAGSIAATYCAGVVSLLAEKRMAEQLQILTQLSNVGSTLKDAETGQRGFLLTGEDRYLEPYTSALSQLQGEFGQLQKHVASGEISKVELDDIIVLSKQKIDELGLTIRLRKERGLEAALVTVRSDRGKVLMDQIRSVLAQMQSRAQARYDRAVDRVAWTGTARTVVYVVIGVLNLCFLGWVYGKTSAEIRRRIAADLQIRESESRFRALVTASSDAVYRMSPDWSEMSHLRGRDFIADTDAPNGAWLEKYIDAKDRPLVLATIKQAVETKTIFALEHPVLRADGSLGWTFSRAVPLLDAHGEITEWFGAASDITARKEAEQKLRTQLARLDLLSQTTRAIGERQDLKSIFQVVVRSVEDNLPVDFGCICLYDAGSAILTINSVGVKSYELALELAMPEQATVPIDANGLSQCIKGNLVYEPDTLEVPFPFPQRLANGGLRAMVIAPLLVESSVFGVFIAARREAHSFSSTDCEFLRQLSEHVALASHQAQLHAALQRAYEDLRQTQQAIMQQERLRALGQMASGIAHDINNAISPVALYTQALLERETLSERARNYLQTIRSAIDDVAATVARMREFYRQREPQLNLAPVDFNKIIPQVLELTRARWGDMPQQRGIVINLRTEYATDLPAANGVESELREALINLVFNAVDAMPQGGTMTLRTKATEDHRVQVEVADTGVGMDEDTRRRCLEPFFTTKGERGTGLGLAMVYGMVKRHNAEIDLESAVGNGTTVRITFNAASSTGNSTDKPDQEYRVPSRLRILVVDDDPMLLKSLRDTLEDDGHVVTTANGGQSGIDTFRMALEKKQPFAVVISDLGMPYVDGRNVAKAIKAVSSSTPVILLTGWGQRLVDEKDIPSHVDRVLSKPPKLPQLREALAHCCAAVATEP